MANDTVKLTGKTALITGAARRIGAGMAWSLHAQGMNVVLHCRSSVDEAQQLSRALNRLRADSAIVAQADLNHLPGLESLIKAASQWGSLDVLVNNASSFYATPIGSITETDWEDIISSNLKAPLFLSQAAAKKLRRSRGVIINMVDIHARRPMRNHLLYSVAKAGLETLTYALARELAPEVRVNGIAPGAILWPESGLDEKQKQQIIDRIALKRAGTVKDIAKTLIYLVRDAPYVTGQVIAVDGGRSIGW